MIGLIYTLADPNTGEVRYCGKTFMTKRHRLDGHRDAAKRHRGRRHSANWLYSLYDRGLEPLWTVIEEVDVSAALDAPTHWCPAKRRFSRALGKLERAKVNKRLSEREVHHIAALKGAGVRLTNSTEGGEGNVGWVMPDAARVKIGAAHKGKKISIEHRERLRAAHLAREPETFVRGEKHPMFGRPFVCENEAARVEKIKTVWSKERRRAHGDRYAGTANANAKIDSDTAIAIYLTDGSCEAVARQFGVTLKIVHDIKSGMTWTRATSRLPAHKPLRNQTVLDESKVSRILRSRAPAKDIAKEFKISVSTVYQILSRSTWKHVKVGE